MPQDFMHKDFASLNLDDTDALIAAVRNGDMVARNELMERIYPELRNLAKGLMANERRDHTLGMTGSALVNLLWLRLLAPQDAESPDKPREDLGILQSRQHLMGIAVRNMRKILVDYSRMSRAKKRPKKHDKVDVARLNSLGESMASADADALDISEALKLLEPIQPESARALELKYFAGLTNEEGALAMGIPLIRFRRRCEAGLDFLRNELGKNEGRRLR